MHSSSMRPGALRPRLFWLLALAPLVAACDDEGSAQAEQQGTLDGQVAPDEGPMGADFGVDSTQADAAPADATLPDAAAPDALVDHTPVDGPGPFHVGFHTETIEYTNPALGETRPLDLHWWYPTEATTGSGPRYAGIFPRPEVFADAPPWPGQAPLVVFSHGNGGLAEQSFFFTEFLASHGFVVVAPDHTGNTFRDSSAPIWQLFELRPEDIGAVLDFADALPGDHPLAGHLGPERALSGHSFGGYTTLAAGGAGYAVDALVAACAEPPDSESEACVYLLNPATQARYSAGFADDRLMALIPLAPAGANLFGGEVGLPGITLPTLLMTAAQDATLPNPVEGDPLWAGLTAPDRLRLDFTRAGHFTFSNACTLAPASATGDGCGPEFIDPTQAHRLINAYALAFLRLHLLGDGADAALLAGTTRLEEGEIELTVGQ